MRLLIRLISTFAQPPHPCSSHTTCPPFTTVYVSDMTRQTVEIIIYRFTSCYDYDIIIAQLTQGSSSTPEGDVVERGLR